MPARLQKIYKHRRIVKLNAFFQISASLVCFNARKLRTVFNSVFKSANSL